MSDKRKLKTWKQCEFPYDSEVARCTAMLTNMTLLYNERVTVKVMLTAYSDWERENGNTAKRDIVSRVSAVNGMLNDLVGVDRWKKKLEPWISSWYHHIMSSKGNPHEIDGLMDIIKKLKYKVYDEEWLIKGACDRWGIDPYLTKEEEVDG